MMINYFRGLLLVGCVPAAATAQITMDLSASRTSGTAPLAVFFDATGTRHADASVDEFHELHYEWNFGDGTGRNWIVSGMDRSRAIGPLAGHVFEPSSYPDDCGKGPGTCKRMTVTLTISDHLGNQNTREVVIAIEDPEARFGNSTVCISRTSDAIGCPTSATRRLGDTRTLESVLSSEVDGNGFRRVLFRAGQEWTSASMYSISAPGPGLIGSFDAEGMCSSTNPCVPKTVANYTNTSGTALLFNDDDWRVMDLDLRGPGTTDTRAIGFWHTQSNKQVDDNVRNTILRVDASRFLTAFGTGGYNGVEMDEAAIADSTCSSMVGDNGGYCAFIVANKLLILGNDFDRDGGLEHVIRLPRTRQAVIAHNRLAEPGATKHHIKLHAMGAGEDLLSRQVVISDNYLDGGPNGWILTIGPAGNDQDQVVEDVIVERNRFRAGPGNSVFVSIWAQRVTARANLFDSTQASKATYGFVVDKRGTGPQSIDVAGNRIYNNTCYSGSTEAIVFVANRVGAVGTKIQNNLLFAPFASLTNVLVDQGTGTVSGSNVNRSSSPSPFVGPLTEPSGLRLDPANASLADGGVPIEESSFVDFAGIRMKRVPAPSVGAWASGGAPLAPIVLKP